MSTFDQLARDRISVTKADGRELGPYKATVDQATIICLDKNADFEPGDRVSRTLPNGKADVYYVVDATFRDGSGLSTDLSHWEVKTSRTAPGTPESGGPMHSSIHIHGSHNVQIGDGNQQAGNITLGEILRAVDESEGSEEQKQDGH